MAYRDKLFYNLSAFRQPSGTLQRSRNLPQPSADFLFLAPFWPEGEARSSTSPVAPRRGAARRAARSRGVAGGTSMCQRRCRNVGCQRRRPQPSIAPETQGIQTVWFQPCFWSDAGLWFSTLAHSSSADHSTIRIGRRRSDEWQFNSGHPGHGGVRCSVQCSSANLASDSAVARVT